MSRKRWNRERVIEAIRAIGGQGADPRLYSAARWYFGRWHVALAAAGFATVATPRRSFRRSTRGEVLADIRRRYQCGQSFTLKKNKSLGSAAIGYFGSWSTALSVAGIPPTRLRWSAERVLQELRRLDQQGAFDDSTRIPDRRLVVAAERYFGSRRRALIAAGILAADETGRRTIKWTRRRVVEALQDRHVRGLSVRGDVNLVGAAKRRFGSLHPALVVAGIPAEKPAPRQRWSRQRVIQVLRDRHRRGRLLTPAQDGNLTGAAKRYFGRWSCALAAAGIAPMRKRIRKHD